LSTVSSPFAARRPVWGVVYAGVALTTAATLILELALTRLFSVIFYYHFAFLAISAWARAASSPTFSRNAGRPSTAVWASSPH
jgi:hypothetical protein